ncbi:MAG TPA: hypothetical protein VGB98_11650 [Pyrinomonadaceae bacterium]
MSAGETRPAVGVAAQALNGEEVLRGVGAPVAKSDAFWFVSVQPPAARRTALVFDGAGAFPEPSEQLAVPKPTKSINAPPAGHEPVSAAAVLVSATLPAVAANWVVPVASAAGRSVVPPAPCACRTR